jgi:hypothetical protein
MEPGKAKTEAEFAKPSCPRQLQKNKIIQAATSQVAPLLKAKGYASWDDWGYLTDGPEALRDMVGNLYAKLEAGDKTSSATYDKLSFRFMDGHRPTLVAMEAMPSEQAEPAEGERDVPIADAGSNQQRFFPPVGPSTRTARRREKVARRTQQHEEC